MKPKNTYRLELTPNQYFSMKFGNELEFELETGEKLILRAKTEDFKFKPKRKATLISAVKRLIEA